MAAVVRPTTVTRKTGTGALLSDGWAVTGTTCAYAGAPTDQHLPYDMPGFSDVGIYPSQPNLVEARRLAGCTGDTPDTCPARSGVFYCADRAPAPQICDIVRTNLLQIGLTMQVMLFPRAVQFPLTGRRGEPFDMTDEGWVADYADPYDFIDVLLNGKNIHEANNNNYSYFNDPKFIRKMEAAASMTGSKRFQAYGNLDVDLSRNAVPWAARANSNDRVFISGRVGCYMFSPVYQTNLAAMCVK